MFKLFLQSQELRPENSAINVFWKTFFIAFDNIWNMYLVVAFSFWKFKLISGQCPTFHTQWKHQKTRYCQGIKAENIRLKWVSYLYIKIINPIKPVSFARNEKSIISIAKKVAHSQESNRLFRNSPNYFLSRHILILLKEQQHLDLIYWAINILISFHKRSVVKTANLSSYVLSKKLFLIFPICSPAAS